MKTNLKVDATSIRLVSLRELTNEEIVGINGGDEFMRDLGRLCGNIYNWLKSSSEVGSPTMTGDS